MNLILFERAELDLPLPRADPRARHILEVLRRGNGDSFDVGLVNGPIGKAVIVQLGDAALSLTFTWSSTPPKADLITLLIGLPRPQTARDILRDATTIGVGAIHFVATERSDANYATSSLWTSGEWRRHCLAGAAQAFSTQVPTVTSGSSLDHALGALPTDCQRLAPDNYEATAPLSECHVLRDTPLTLAFGPERGWGPADRTALRSHGFILVHLGSRVLRSETAVVAALALVRARVGLM